MGRRCDYGSLHDALLDYLSALTRAGVTLLVVVDGMQDWEKEATTLNRRRSQVCARCGHVRRQRSLDEDVQEATSLQEMGPYDLFFFFSPSFDFFVASQSHQLRCLAFFWPLPQRQQL